MITVCIADGWSTHVPEWTNWFARRGHTVHLVSPRFPADASIYDPAIKRHQLLRLPPGSTGQLAGYLGSPAWPGQV
ncbi:MAG: hypothetical protein PHU08_04405, partial [Dehalococcoidales bacterium]|nr:hypothetical protein [Dehalococcoidales bacterium]